MSKSKNHTNHNQIKKAHRNGLKKPIAHKYGTQKGLDAKFLRNQRFAKKGTQKAIAAAATKA
ncbi:ribosomal L29e protein family-domain-containing protein, partial [Mucor mucedo]|uniref:60S ribosomal protein L29 n=1 Tax=Mucor saturninus TaxID=64648 RepID=A0A8H7V566_9FUNG